MLASLRDLITARKPFIRAEMFKLLDLSQRERLYDLLVELGYDLFRVESDARYAGERLDRHSLMTPRHYDVFCIPKSRHSPRD